jgi:DNA helicase-2/ATP-dependent DNA helicase PcrA
MNVLSDNPDILKKYQDKFKYILVDEFQDTNSIQFKVIQMLALPENNLFVVGDDDQSIYKFRGARPEIMLDFPNIYPKCKIYNLDINYRSTPAIVEGAQIVIAHNKKRYEKTLKAKKTTGENIYIETMTSQFDEMEQVVNKINENINLGISPSEIAVIYRTNLQTRVLTDVLMKHNIPFFVRDGVANIYEHWIAKDIFAYVQLAMGKPETIHIQKIINKPKRYVETKCLNSITDLTLDKIIEYYQNTSEKDWLIDGLIKLKGHIETLQTLTKPTEIVNYIINDIGYMAYLKDYAEKTNENFDDLSAIVDELLNTSQGYNTCEEWFEGIVSYTDKLNDAKKNNHKEENSINLLTMHASKGLEYDVVFIIDAN